MVTLQDRLDRDAAIPVVDPEPRQVRLFTTPEYAEAQLVVDRLSDLGFPVHHTAIVGEGIQMYERITGRRDWLRAMIDGAVDGFSVGLVLGVVLAILSIQDPLFSAGAAIVTAVVAGTIVGALIRLIGHLSRRGRRDFSSIHSFRASEYTVMCEAEYADKARELLSSPAAGS